MLTIALTIVILRLSYKSAMQYVHPQRLARTSDNTPARQEIYYIDVTLKTSDGLSLAAWYTPPQNGVVILTAHGIHAHRSTTMHALFARHGYGVVSWDFRAHGESEGELCTLGYYETRDVEAALDFALSQPEVTRVGVWGESMGGAAAIRTAARRPEIEAVVADSTFATIEEELNVILKVAFLRPLVRFFAEQETGIRMDKLRPIDDVGQISPRPVFIIQGEADGIVPSDTATRLYNAAGEPRFLWTEPAVDHVQMHAVHPDAYEQRVVAFFDAALLKDNP